MIALIAKSQAIQGRAERIEATMRESTRDQNKSIPEYWIKRAAKARAMAEQMGDREKAMSDDIARSYELLAESAAKRLKD